MHLKADDDNERYGDYLQSWKIMRLVKKYSDYIRWPIQMDIERPEMKETGETNEDGSPKYETVTKVERETINSQIPIWQRSKSEVTDEQCMEFYKEKFHDSTDPAAVITHQRRGPGELQGHAVHPRQTVPRLYDQLLRARPGALLQRGHDHGAPARTSWPRAFTSCAAWSIPPT